MFNGSSGTGMFFSESDRGMSPPPPGAGVRGFTMGWLAESVACAGAMRGLLSNFNAGPFFFSFSTERTSPWLRRAFTCSSTVLEQLPSMKSARCSSPFFRSMNRLLASPRLRLLDVVRRDPRGSVSASALSTWLLGLRSHWLYLPSESLTRKVPSSK